MLWAQPAEANYVSIVGTYLIEKVRRVANLENILLRGHVL